ncbi:MAG: DUF2442 domain-containing protein [Pseudobdellovibrionaceae bacterium]
MKELKIESATYLKDYKLAIRFNDGKNQEVDFGPFLKASTHPEIIKFLSKNRFKKFVVQNGDLMWDDYDLIFPVYDLYTNSIAKAGNKNPKEAS